MTNNTWGLNIFSNKKKSNKGILDDIKPIGIFNTNSKHQVSRDERRTFTRAQKEKILSNQKFKCAICKKSFSKEEIAAMTIDFDHIKPWSEGGRTVVSNGQAVHKYCHKKKTNDEIVKKIESKDKTKDYWINPITGLKEPKPPSLF